MTRLTPAGQNIVSDVACRYNISQDAVIHMLIAVNNGAGTMAQFNCPELGGSGQWMMGGMTMVGDMFNHGLQATVDNLCTELSSALSNNQMFPPAPRGQMGGASQWWPADLGVPSSSGGQNNIRYAVFPNRLAVALQGNVTVYDTLDHQIGGVSQQQGGDTSLTFSSQYGTVSVNSLPIISGPGLSQKPNTNFAEPPPRDRINSSPSPPPIHQGSPDGTEDGTEVVGLIEKLSALHDAGALSNEEFNAKKAELLSRI